MQRRLDSLDAEGRLRKGTLLGPYEIVGPLGAGGMGEVYRAVDTRLGREVAIKVLGAQSELDPSRRRRFDREARLASAVNHPHVLTLHDVGVWEDLPYVVSELLEGETLRAYLRPRFLSWGRAVELGVQIARGLDALHSRGIVHRDLKPENLFVTSDNHVKILDLGLAGPFQGPEREETPAGPWETLTTEGAAVGGTASYMSPEQVRCVETDPRSDIFSCGVVLYEMLARRRPFIEDTAAETMTAILRREAPPLGQLDPSVPPAVVRVVERCLKKSPEDRFHSAHDLALALEATLEPRSRPQPAAGPSIPAPTTGRRWLGRLRIALVAVALLATVRMWTSGPQAPDGAVLPAVVASERRSPSGPRGLARSRPTSRWLHAWARPSASRA